MKKSLISAIKKLFAKLGAEDIEGNNLVEVIDNGADALDSGGSGSSPLVVTFSGTTEGGDAACDKTFAEIASAYSSGREIRAKYVNEEDGTCANLSVCWIHSVVQFAYSCFHDNGDGTFVPVTLVYCEYDESETVAIETYFD